MKTQVHLCDIWKKISVNLKEMNCAERFLGVLLFLAQNGPLDSNGPRAKPKS